MKMFPIQGGPALPWSMIEPFADQVDINHGQTLEQLAGRGGLGTFEACCALENRRLFRQTDIPEPGKASEAFYLERLRKHIKKDQTAELERFRKCIEDLVEEREANCFDNTAGAAALNEIAALCGVAEWDYPGQVVRDVQKLVDQTAELHCQKAAGFEGPETFPDCMKFEDCPVCRCKNVQIMKLDVVGGN